MATFMYPQVATGLAMKIAKMSALETLDARVWAKFAENVGLSVPFVRKRVVELSKLIIEQCDGVSRGLTSNDFDTETTAKLAKTLPERARMLRLLVD